jgi:alpha-1,3-mannosyltransferase
MDPADTTFPRLECPFTNEDRYAYLKNSSAPSEKKRPSYFFALDLHQRREILPRLMGSIVEAMKFLGPENCALSIIEGRSDDGTLEVLQELRIKLNKLGVRYYWLRTSDIDPLAKGGDRVWALALLRNLAIVDLHDVPTDYASDTTVIFLNDISVCLEDILEIIHQRRFQEADMTCAMDWTYVGPDPTFYDVWIARGMTGDTFFRIPADGSWDYAWDLFWNDSKAYSRWSNWKPFQVFACWNGMVAFTAKPIMDGTIRFRRSNDDECYQGEPRLFAKDMWYHGYRKIAVVPSVNVGYSDEDAKKLKALKGYTSSHVANEGEDVKIEWENDPPAEVKCMLNYENQYFVPWDQGLGPSASENKTSAKGG